MQVKEKATLTWWSDIMNSSALTWTRAQVRVRVSPGALPGHQLIPQRRDPPADVHGRDGFHKQSPILQAEAAHGGLSVLVLRQQELQIARALQVHMRPLNTDTEDKPSLVNHAAHWGPCVSGYLGVAVGLDAHVEPRPVCSGGRRVGPQVDNDGSGGIEPLQRALRAAEVDLLHVSAVRLVAQAAAGRVQGVKTTAHFQNDKARSGSDEHMEEI